MFPFGCANSGNLEKKVSGPTPATVPAKASVSIPAAKPFTILASKPAAKPAIIPATIPANPVITQDCESIQRSQKEEIFFTNLRKKYTNYNLPLINPDEKSESEKYLRNYGLNYLAQDQKIFEKIGIDPKKPTLKDIGFLVDYGEEFRLYDLWESMQGKPVKISEERIKRVEEEMGKFPIDLSSWLFKYKLNPFTIHGYDASSGKHYINKFFGALDKYHRMGLMNIKEINKKDFEILRSMP